MKRTNFHIPEPTRIRLKTLSAATGITVAELVRRAIDEYLDRHPAQPVSATATQGERSKA
jgi:predicted DNA-binding protein